MSLTSPQQVVVIEFGNDTTQQTQRTFARANLLRRYGLAMGKLVV